MKFFVKHWWIIAGTLLFLWLVMSDPGPQRPPAKLPTLKYPVALA